MKKETKAIWIQEEEVGGLLFLIARRNKEQHRAKNKKKFTSVDRFLPDIRIVQTIRFSRFTFPITFVEMNIFDLI